MILLGFPNPFKSMI